MEPKLILGNSYKDDRGQLCFNNDFDASPIKRIYTIKNTDTNFVRAWQGHKIEKRWFSAVKGKFQIKLIKVDDWENPSKNLPQLVFEISEQDLAVLAVPQGYITSIKELVEDSILLVMSDYFFKEIQDEYRFNSDYFYEQL